MIDPAALTADLIRCASVTPQEGGALQLLDLLLTSHGFHCTFLRCHLKCWRIGSSTEP